MQGAGTDGGGKTASHQQVRIPREQPTPYNLWSAYNVAARHQLQLLAALPTLATTQQHDKLALTAKLLLKTLHADAFSPQTLVCQLQTRTTFTVRSQQADRTLYEQQRYRDVLRCAAEALIQLVHPAQHHALDQFFRRTEPFMVPGRFGALRDLHDGTRFPTRHVEAASFRLERAALAIQLGAVRDGADLLQDARSKLPRNLAETPQLMMGLGLAQQHLMLCALRSTASGAWYTERPTKRRRHAGQDTQPDDANVEIQPFGHQRGLWRGNEAEAMWLEATKHLKEALQVLSHATYARLQLAQLQACAGRAQQAATTIHAAPDTAPHDVDAWALRVLGLQATQNSPVKQVGHCCVEMLRCDPGAVQALQVLRAVYVLNPESTLSLWIEGLLLHLDTCQHVVERVEDAGSIGVLAWSWLADALDRWAGRGRSSDDEADMTRVYEMLVARYWWSAVHFASPWVIQRAGMTGQPWIEVETARARVAAYVLGPAHEYVETTAGLCTPECLPALENSAAAAAQYAPRLLPPCARNAASSAHPTDTQDSLQWASSKRMGMLLVPPRSWWGVFAQVRRAGCGDAA